MKTFKCIEISIPKSIYDDLTNAQILKRVKYDWEDADPFQDFEYHTAANTFVESDCAMHEDGVVLVAIREVGKPPRLMEVEVTMVPEFNSSPRRKARK